MKGDAVERIIKLVRLAGNNPNDEEARTAALMACRLMVEHEVLVRAPGESERPVPPTWAPPAAFTGTVREFLDARDVVRQSYLDWEQQFWESLKATGRRH